LDQIVINNNDAYQFLLISLRIFCFVMLIPGIGEVNVPSRIRLLISLTISIPAFYFVPSFGNVPESAIILVLCVLYEALIGIALGLISRMMIFAIVTAGMIIATTSGLSVAVLFDPSQAIQSSIFGAFMTMLYVLLFLTTDSHIMLIQGIINSYSVFPAFSFGQNYAFFSESIVKLVAEIFKIAISLSAPFLVVSVLSNLAGGILSRIMPQMQVFFILIPAQILISFILFTLTLSGAIIWLISEHNAKIATLFGG
jgi:flagellar biosynthesis protein FliR